MKTVPDSISRIAPLLILLAACGAPRHQTAAPPSVTADSSSRAEWRFQTAATAHGIHGMIATESETATRVGLDILRNGGSAVDAAIATVFALAVAYPAAGNIGGGGFMVVHMRDGTTAALDFRETAPRRAERTMFAGTGGSMLGRSRTGHLAVGVPGTVAGMAAAHQRFGTLPWQELVAPSVQLAESGVMVDAYTANTLTEHAGRLRGNAASAALFFPRDMPLRAGMRWRNPELAAVLRRIAVDGAPGFYRGATADMIISEMQRGGGIITHGDLRDYQAKWRTPIEFEYRGLRAVSMPPPSSGGITLALIANILSAYDLRTMGRHTPAAMHVMAEAMRRSFAVRNEVLGDPDFIDVPTSRLLSDSFAVTLRRSIDEWRATPSDRVSGKVGGAAEGNHTTHLSIVDRYGNAVALTTTLNNDFGSAVTVAGAGFLLNNEMDDFTAEPGTPNGFGLVQGDANAIAPGKRMLSSMAPTIVIGRDSIPVLIVGAGGGSRIISAVFQVMSHVIDYDMDLASAVTAPRLHHQHLPDAIAIERGFALEVRSEIEQRGHAIRLVDGVAYVTPIARANGGWVGVSDPRVGGLAAGF